MVFLNQDQLLGSIVPDVYISKITLETGGGAPALKENDPHIDLKRTPEKVADPLTGQLVPARAGVNFDSKNLFSESPYPPSSEKLIITLDLILKEKLDNGLIGTWFTNHDFSKYLRLKIIQITKPELTMAASLDRNVLLTISKDNIVPVSNEISMANFNILSEYLGTNDVKSAMKIIHSSTEEKTLNVHNDIAGDKSKITQHYSEVDSDGNTITTFVFRTKFELNEQSPAHLSYFAFSYLDLEQLAKDFRLKLDSRMMLEPYGKIVSDIVFENGETVDESYIFLDSDEAIWPGPIDEDDNGNFFGITKDGSPILLQRNLVGNSKLQDFRNFADIERLFLDFSVIENEILNLKLDGPRRDKLNIKPEEPPFSDFHISQDDEGNVRFFFALNFRKLLALNAYYGKLFSNVKTGRVAVADSSIVSMKIFRRRIKGSPEIGSSLNYAQLFEENQIDDTIVISGEKIYKEFLSKNTAKSAIRELKDIFVPSGTPEQQNIVDMRYFTGADKTTDDITDGYYVYGVEIEIQDSSLDFIRNRILELQQSRISLEDYLSKASRLESTQTLVANDNPHIDYPGETKLDQTTFTPGNFNPLLNRFTQNFINEQIRQYGLADDAITPWTTAVEKYIEILKLFVPNADVIPFDKFEKSLLFFVHPATGNPSGIMKVSKLMETLETILSKVVGDIILPNSSSRTVSNSSAGSKVPMKTFKIVKFFNNAYNSSIPKTIGYDFLDIAKTEEQIDGLLTVTGEEYAMRVERETNHYYIQPEGQKPNINIKVKEQEYTKSDTIDNTSFSYFTPAKISFADKFKVTRIGHSPTPF